MPADEIMAKFRAHELHSGRGGPVVRKKRQAKAILLSYLRKEGKLDGNGPAAPAGRRTFGQAATEGE